MREELKQKYETISWESATNSINTCLKEGEIAMAKKLAGQAIENWQEESKMGADKTEIIDKFKEWLKEKNIDPDDLSA